MKILLERKKVAGMLSVAALCLVVAFFSQAGAFTAGGCDGDCEKCHSLNEQEVSGILKKTNLADAKIIGIRISPVKSLWEISLENKGQRGIIYIDFSKRHIVSGPVIEVESGADKTKESYQKIKKKVDFSRIPLENALVMGNRNAPRKVVVFTDPD
ncbi:MAG: hypothetical protein K8I29_15320 [Alphaproteobacteria bacterium]|uniref:Disulphide bond isomerase DsbC/G N-terminal domain-containing protein n=1 Tax=Candidatus Nitrobium versatile TaxID=2884831 RepID=A0A953J891_9BACT|nr:hypothetical protein [Candidatus Nitrobium versatile]